MTDAERTEQEDSVWARWYEVSVSHNQWQVECQDGLESGKTKYDLDFLRRVRVSLAQATKRIEREINEQEVREATSG